MSACGLETIWLCVCRRPEISVRLCVSACEFRTTTRHRLPSLDDTARAWDPWHACLDSYELKSSEGHMTISWRKDHRLLNKRKKRRLCSAFDKRPIDRDHNLLLADKSMSKVVTSRNVGMQTDIRQQKEVLEWHAAERRKTYSSTSLYGIWGVTDLAACFECAAAAKAA